MIHDFVFNKHEFMTFYFLQHQFQLKLLTSLLLLTWEAQLKLNSKLLLLSEFQEFNQFANHATKFIQT
jgi:hypothetical protein